MAGASGSSTKVVNEKLHENKTDPVTSLQTIWSQNKNIHHEFLFQELIHLIETTEGTPMYARLLDCCGLTPLHIATITNNYDQVLSLLRSDEELKTINDVTNYGETALYFASYLGSVAVMLLLLENGARVTTDVISKESELLGATRKDQTVAAEILLANGSNIDVLCEDWAAIHVACFNKTPNMVRLLVECGANVNLIGDWSYSPVNLLFVEFAKREKYMQPCNDEWLVNRCLKELLKSGELDPNYWSRSPLGNPPVLQRALVMLSPTICRELMNNSTSSDTLTDWRQQAVHDELAMFSIKSTHLGFGLYDRIQRYQDCLELVINHGIEPIGFNQQDTMRLLLRQLKRVPLTKRQPEMEPVFKMLIDYSLQPIKLKSLCRRTIRIAVGHPAEERINSIRGLAPKLKSYLLMEDIGGCELYSC